MNLILVSTLCGSHIGLIKHLGTPKTGMHQLAFISNPCISLSKIPKFWHAKDLGTELANLPELQDVVPINTPNTLLICCSLKCYKVIFSSQPSKLKGSMRDRALVSQQELGPQWVSSKRHLGEPGSKPLGFLDSRLSNITIFNCQFYWILLLPQWRSILSMTFASHATLEKCFIIPWTRKGFIWMFQ